MSDAQDPLICLGSFPVHEARVLLDALVAENIPFSLEEESEAMQQMSFFAAANGGFFDAGSGITIQVDPEDEPRAAEIRNRIFNIQL